MGKFGLGIGNGERERGKGEKSLIFPNEPLVLDKF
jgi:hypothetical protein